jgi:outer membrane protein
MIFKRFTVMVLLMFAFNILLAQHKIGGVDLEAIIKRMPEKGNADSIIKFYQDSLQTEYEKLEKVCNKRLESLMQGNHGLGPISDTLKQVKREEMIALIVQLQNFSQNAVEIINKRAEQLRLQVMSKLKESMRNIADENGYSYILNICEDSKLPLPPNTDITSLVFAKLGL